MWSNVRFFLGGALVESASSQEEILYGIKLLEQGMHEFRILKWSQFKNQKSGPIVALYENILSFSHPGFQAVCNSFFKALVLQGRYNDAITLYSDMLYMVPEEIRNVNRRSNAYKELFQILYLYLKELLFILPRVTEDVQWMSLRLSSIRDTLLPLTNNYQSGIDLTKEDISFLETITRALVYISPRTPSYLCALGQSQLNQFDKNPLFDRSLSKLDEAKVSFTMAIASEAASEILTPDASIQAQSWYKDLQKWIDRLNALEKERLAKVTKKPAAGKTTDTKKGVGVKGAAPATKATTTAKAPIGKETVKTTAGKDTAKPASSKPVAVKTTNATAPKTEPTVANKKGATGNTGAIKSAAKEITTNADEPVVSDKMVIDRTKQITKLYASRIGLARTLARMLTLSQESKDGKATQSILSEISQWYREAMTLEPKTHDAYIELGSLTEKYVNTTASVDIYSSYPFDVSAVASQDDLFLHGEVSRILMKEKKFKDPRLAASLIAEGRAMGMRSLAKYIEILDAANESQLLIKVYAGANGKPETDVCFSSKIDIK